MLHAHPIDSTDFALAFAVYATCLCFALEPIGICGSPVMAEEPVSYETKEKSPQPLRTERVGSLASAWLSSISTKTRTT